MSAKRRWLLRRRSRSQWTWTCTCCRRLKSLTPSTACSISSCSRCSTIFTIKMGQAIVLAGRTLTTRHLSPRYLAASDQGRAPVPTHTRCHRRRSCSLTWIITNLQPLSPPPLAGQHQQNTTALLRISHQALLQPSSLCSRLGKAFCSIKPTPGLSEYQYINHLIYNLM